MPRIRNLKPEFFTDAEMVELPPLHRLFFQGLWCWADREGRLEDRPKDLKVRILPADKCDAEAMLADLERAGRIVRYTVDGERFIQVCNFTKHQRCHKDEKPSRLPGPPETPSQTVDAAVALLRSAGKNPQATASPPMTAGNFGALRPETETETETDAGDGDGTPEPPPPARPAPVRLVGGLRDGLDAAYLKAKGVPFDWRRKDEEAIRALLAYPEAEVLRRWEIALNAAFPTCLGVFSLVEHWNAYAAPRTAGGAGPPRRDSRRGVARAEDADHSKNRVLPDGTIDF